MSKPMSWYEYFSKMTLLVASKSEDESTQCGAIIVAPTYEILSTGYNGFPRGIKDTPERQERPIKYKFFEHAERNAIYNAARIGTATKGNLMFVTGVPCADCARGIIQAGITKVVALEGSHESEEFKARWKESTDFTKDLFEEAGVLLEIYPV